MASVTLTTLLARVRERADMVGSAFVADAATGLYAWVNEANQKLHGMLVDALGEEYVSSVSSINTVVGTSDYNLPTDFFKLYAVDMSVGGRTISLVPFNRSERDYYRNAQLAGYGREVPKYRVVGSKIRLSPTPTSILPVGIAYAPEPALLTTGTDTVNYPNGWERFIVIDAAIQALLKEESSVTALVSERQAIIREIELTKETRDLANPKRVVDVVATDVEQLW